MTKKNSIWKTFPDECRLQTEDPETVRRIKTWSFARQVGEGMNCYLYIFAIPAVKYGWVCKTLGLSKLRRSAAQSEQTRSLLEQGQGYRFRVSHSGQDSRWKAPESTISTGVAGW